MQKASPARTGNMKKQFELIPVLMVKLSLNPHTKPYPIQRLALSFCESPDMGE